MDRRVAPVGTGIPALAQQEGSSLIDRLIFQAALIGARARRLRAEKSRHAVENRSCQFTLWRR